MHIILAMWKKPQRGQEELLARFVCAMEALVDRSRENFATKCDLEKMEERIMSTIADFAAKVNTAFDAISVSVDGLVADVAFLKDQIAKLQASAGTVTPEDQALLDAIDARVTTIASKVKALDDQTEEPPTP